jgi:2-dehydropantoate 2-reductase
VAVLGAGAVGCYFGGMLARSAVPVTLIGRAPHMEAIARDGLLLDRGQTLEPIPVRATANLEEGLRGAAVVLFCVKTTATESTAREMEPFLAPDTAVLSFQNGVDNVDRIHSATGRHAVPVAVYVAAEMTAPGRVTHSGRGDLVMGHRTGWPPTPDLQPLAAMFEQAEVPCRISPAIETELWTKMTMNCAYNALSALTRSQYGRIVQFQPVRSLGQQAIEETVAVARAEGIPLSAPALIQAAIELARIFHRVCSCAPWILG